MRAVSTTTDVMRLLKLFLIETPDLRDKSQNRTYPLLITLHTFSPSGETKSTAYLIQTPVNTQNYTFNLHIIKDGDGAESDEESLLFA
jgi:hypothetical protein